MTDSAEVVSKRNRANKNRGRAFERKVADLLGWTRVPYSGGVKEWGGGDVVDGYFKNNGQWAAECKTQQPKASYSITDKYIRQAMSATTHNGRFPVIVVKHVGQKHGYVFMTTAGYDYIEDHFKPGTKFRKLDAPKRGKGEGFIVPVDAMPRENDILQVYVVHTRTGYGRYWYVVRLDTFADIVTTNKLMSFDRERE